MGSRGARAARAGAVAAVAAAALTGCGGDDRQDADEPSGTFRVQVVDADFPLKQSLAKAETFKVAVRNTGSEEVPNVAVTVDSFSSRSKQQGLADPERPVWIIDEGPRGGTTAYTNTWALGPLRPGATREFTWKVTAVQPGTHVVRYRVAAGLDGKAKAEAPNGEAPAGEFTVDVSDEPSVSRVDPETGEVVREGE